MVKGPDILADMAITRCTIFMYSRREQRGQLLALKPEPSAASVTARIFSRRKTIELPEGRR